MRRNQGYQEFLLDYLIDGILMTLVRFIFAIFTIANFGLGIIIYIILASYPTNYEDIEVRCMENSHARSKKLNLIDDDKGWFW